MITYLLIIMLQTNFDTIVLTKEVYSKMECEQLQQAWIENVRTVGSAEVTATCAEVRR